MKRLMLTLPLIVSACGDDVEAKLATCRDELRSELKDLADRTKRDTAESLKALEGRWVTAERQTTEPLDDPSDKVIKTLPDMLAAAVPLIEAQLNAFPATPDGLAQCRNVLAELRRR